MYTFLTLPVEYNGPRLDHRSRRSTEPAQLPAKRGYLHLKTCIVCEVQCMFKYFIYNVQEMSKDCT